MDENNLILNFFEEIILNIRKGIDCIKMISNIYIYIYIIFFENK